MATYDLVVIGAGIAGLTCAREARRLGAKVAIIERHSFGGDITNELVPTAVYSHASHLLGLVKSSGPLGVAAEETGLDLQRLHARAIEATAIIGYRLSAEKAERLGVDVYWGEASFLSADELRVDGDVLPAGEFVIATGSEPEAPSIKGLKESGYLTYPGILRLESIPRSIGVIGAGPFGLEFAQFLSRFGTEVTVFEQGDHILPDEDAELADFLEDTMAEQGISFYTGAKVTRVERVAEGCEVTVDMDGAEEKEVVQEVLVASGRRPATGGLNLRAASVAATPEGIVVDDELRTTMGNVWACGDVTGKRAWASVAAYQGRIAALNALAGAHRTANYEAIPMVIRTEPEIGRVGLTEEQAEAMLSSAAVSYSYFTDNDMAIITDQMIGFVKLIADAERSQLVGAHVIGPAASEIISELAFAIKCKSPLTELADLVHCYPSAGECIHQAAEDLVRQVEGS
ncbi:MAG: NAD(P)/FAD-dependent oxidoreductase [Chloroflexi bacterium]|nr:NAD(P)/FAD-dependent oxidoreductase [Chloroflexota bacterium]